uniref:Uncharacterized protein n=1 Tax=Oryza rufipogon TaxID=4529 RepID=A0A0E0NKQ0_ORYRU
MHIAAQAPMWHGVWMVEDAVAGDEFPAWHGYGRRRMQPSGQAPAWCRAWIAKDVVWGVAAEATTASNKSSVGRGSEGRGCRYHLIPHKYHPMRGRNHLIPDRYHMIPYEYHQIRSMNRLILDRYHLIPVMFQDMIPQSATYANDEEGCSGHVLRGDGHVGLMVAGHGEAVCRATLRRWLRQHRVAATDALERLQATAVGAKAMAPTVPLYQRS